MTLVRRKAARQWRRLQRQKRLSGEGVGREDLAIMLTTLSRPQDDPARDAAFRDGVRGLCRNLNDAEHRLQGLRSQGYSPAEIAADLGLSDVAFRVRLTRLRQRLRSAGFLDDWL